jgi:DNA-binding transcriptional LysR family regulator
VTVEPRISANNSLILRDLLVAGAGIGSLPSFVANPSLRSGALVRILGDHRLPTRHVYAVYPTSRHLLRKVRVFVDYLAEAFAREPCGSFAPGE